MAQSFLSTELFVVYDSGSLMAVGSVYTSPEDARESIETLLWDEFKRRKFKRVENLERQKGIRRKELEVMNLDAAFQRIADDHYE